MTGSLGPVSQAYADGYADGQRDVAARLAAVEALADEADNIALTGLTAEARNFASAWGIQIRAAVRAAPTEATE